MLVVTTGASGLELRLKSVITTTLSGAAQPGVLNWRFKGHEAGKEQPEAQGDLGPGL